MEGNIDELLSRDGLLYRRLVLLMDLLRLPNGVLGGLNTSFLTGSVNGKSNGTGFPDLERITKLEKSPGNTKTGST